MKNKVQILSDFNLEEAVSPSVIDEYTDKIPPQVIEIWKNMDLAAHYKVI